MAGLPVTEDMPDEVVMLDAAVMAGMEGITDTAVMSGEAGITAEVSGSVRDGGARTIRITPITCIIRTILHRPLSSRGRLSGITAGIRRATILM